MRFRILCAGFSLLVLAACTSAPASPKKPQITLKGPSAELPITIEIADTDASRAKGLMGRTELSSGSGMLFIFDEDKRAAFWMKNTLIPLDVIYFDAGLRFVSVSSMTPCTKDPCKTYPSAGPMRYALEVPGGYAKQHGIGTGWMMTLPR
jgi:uncharacterized protein